MEVVSERTPRSTVFANPDGTRTLRIYDGVAFVRRPNGGLVELDTALRPGPDGRLVPGAAANVSMAALSTDAAVGGIGFGPDTWVGFGIRDAIGKPATIDGATATYAGVRPGADLVLTATDWGFEEDIILRSKDAPTSWTFPLSLRGLTPELDTGTGTVVFKDGSGKVRGFIPPGFMVDSNVDPRRGTGERSNNVTYTLQQDRNGWAVRVDLDAAWLRDPARVFPVTVDPAFRDDAESDDTFVSSREMANRNNSSESNLPVGTYNGGAEKSASYVHFDQLKSTLANRYILGASANFWNYWSSSCSARPVTVYKVTQPWVGSTTKTWAGPAYDAASPLSTRTFAHGHTNCPGGAWESFALPADRVMGWVHGTESFYGLTLRASLTDSLGWRRFSSANFSDTPARPFLDVNYADQGARYALPVAVFSPPVTATSAGRITIRVTNWGSTTWTPTNGYRLTYKVLNSSGGVIQNGPLINLPGNAGPHQSIDVPVDVAPIGASGNFTLRVDMVNPSGASFNTTYGVPFGDVPFTIANGPPTILGNNPPNNAVVDTLRPTLWADYYDPDNTPAGVRRFTYRICNGTPQVPVGCQTSGQISSATWMVPAGTLAWGKTSFWYVTVSDTIGSSPEIGPLYFTPFVAQPTLTSHLASAGEESEVPGLNPLAGNYASTVTDASVAVAGPALAITRTYNSQDPRISGAFGVGWGSPLDQKLQEEAPDGNVVITTESGRRIRFGRSSDGTFVPPAGANLTLVRTPGSWTLRDPRGFRRVFDDLGRLTSVTDGDGRVQSFRYHSWGVLDRIVDETSGRSLRITWSSGRVSAVSTDPPAVGAPEPTWTYTYTGNLLTSACTPLSAQSCTTYEYSTSSQYRSVVMDDDPVAYWPFGETTGSVAENVVARTAGKYDGTYSNVTFGTQGALGGSTDPAASFTASSGSSVALPTNLFNSSLGYTVEFWYKADPGASGVLLGQQNTPLSGSPTNSLPLVYVGTNGWLCDANPVSPTTTVCGNGTVADGQWHQIVLTLFNSLAEMYIDGAWDGSSGTTNGTPADHRDMSYTFVGNGRATGPTRMYAPTGPVNFPFTGLIDDVAFYRHPLTAAQVAAHYAAGTAAGRLVKVTEPGGFVATQLSHDPMTGRITTLTDRHGTVWNLSDPVPDDGDQVVTLSPNTGESITYRYDAERNGRLISRTDTFGQTTREYNAAGFLSKVTDPNGNATVFDTDARGNVLGRTTCRAVGNCATEYAGYFLNASDPLDPRNDVRVWQADGRSASASDTTFRTTYDIDAAGRVTKATLPKPAGQSSAPTELFNYTNGTEPADGNTVVYTKATQSRTFQRADQTVLSLSGDDNYQQITLPFPVTFYGATYSNAWVSTNGNVSFENPGESSYFNVALPTSSKPNLAAYPFWDDLVVDASASVRTAVTGTAPNRTFIVEWRNVCPYGDTAKRLDFQVALAESGEISFNYAGIDAVPWEQGESATTGVESADGQRATQHSNLQPVLASGTAVVFTPGQARMPAGLLLSSTATNGGIERHFYSGSGDRIRTVDQAGLTTVRTYDRLGRVTATTTSTATENFGTTSFTYNAASLPATRTGPGVLNSVMGVTHTAVTTYGYDAMGRMTTQTVSDSTGGDAARTWTYGYDPAGRLISSRTPDGATTTQEWNNRGETVKVTRPGGLVSEYVYDEAHRMIETAATGPGVDPMTPGATRLVLESRAYDPAGRLASAVDAMGRETGYTYYSDNRLATTSRVRREALGNVTSTTVLSDVDYDRAGNVIRSTGLGGVSTTYTYDAAGYLATSVLDPGGLARTTSYTRNKDGTVSRQTRTGAASPGRTEKTDYAYDTVGRLTTSTVDNTGGSPASLVTRYEWNERGLLTKQTDPTGVATSMGYDKLGNVTTQTGAPRTTWVNGVRTDNVVPVSTLGRNTFGEVTDARNPAGVVSSMVLDAMGRPTQVRLPAYTPPGGSAVNPTISTQYDGRGLPTRVTDELGRVRTSTYDVYGRALTATEPDPDGAGPMAAPVWSYGYDRVGELLDATDPAGAHRLATYDDLGQVRTSTVSDRDTGSTVYYTTTLGYDTFGNPATVLNPLGHTLTLAYNRAGEPTGVTPPTGPDLQVAYDLAGRTVRQTTGGARAATTTYDLAGRPTAQSQHTVTGSVLSPPLGTVTNAYDGAGRLTKLTTAAGRITNYGYDTAGQQVSISQLVDPLQPATAVTVGLGYDALGNQTHLVDGRGNATDTTYNTLGLPESVTEPSTPAHTAVADRTWTTVYDAAGQAVQERLPGGVVRARTFDGLGRLLTETGTGGGTTTATRQLDYDALGRVSKVSGPGGDTTYQWNDRGLLSATSSPTGNASFGYDGAGHLSTRTDVAGTATFTYDPAGRPVTTVDPLTGRTISYSYAATGEPAGFTMGTGAPSRTMSYDDLGRLATDTWRKPDGTAESSTTYGYDLDGTLASKTTTGVAGAGSNTYGYDGLSRLTSWTGPDGQLTSYGYDGASNRTTVTTAAGIRTTAFDDRNRQTSATGAGQADQSWVWTPRGTLASTTTNGQTTSYTVDAFERLTRAQAPGYTVDYTYDGLDRLAQRNGVGYTYDDLTNNPVRSPSSAGEALTFRTPDGTPVSGKTGTAPARSLLTNRHGDLVAAADPGTAAVTASASYDPHGQVTASSGQLPLGFQGGWVDPDTGQVNAHARWYSPGTGSFTSRDTATLAPDPVARANRYQYANAAPTVYADPSGHDPGGRDPYEDCYWEDDEIFICPDPGGGGGGGGGSSSPVQTKPKPKNKCTGSCKIPWLHKISPRKPLGSERSQRPQSEDITGGRLILIEPEPVEAVLTSCDTTDCTPTPMPQPAPGGPAPPPPLGNPNPTPGPSPAPPPPGTPFPFELFCRIQSAMNGPLAGCICLYEPRACWDAFVGFLKAVWEWIVANLPALIALIGIILAAVLCEFFAEICLLLTAIVYGVATFVGCLASYNWPALKEWIPKCLFAALVAAAGGALAGGKVAQQWHELWKRARDWWTRGRGPTIPGGPGGPAPPLPRDILMAFN